MENNEPRTLVEHTEPDRMQDDSSSVIAGSRFKALSLSIPTSTRAKNLN